MAFDCGDLHFHFHERKFSLWHYLGLISRHCQEIFIVVKVVFRVKGVHNLSNRVFSSWCWLISVEISMLGRFLSFTLHTTRKNWNSEPMSQLNSSMDWNFPWCLLFGYGLWDSILIILSISSSKEFINFLGKFQRLQRLLNNMALIFLQRHMMRYKESLENGC